MYLPLFPETGETAILTTVLVGVLWLFALQETIGWPFSGLVVPGLLAAVYLVDPVAAGVTIAEAVITAVLAWLLSDLSARWGLWSRFFGRDQFFLVVVLSTAVRLVVEWGWLEAMVAPDNPGLLGSLNSVGLVLVPLVAYTLCRAGVVRGVPQVAVPTALTWAVLNWVVMPNTNLTLSLFQLDHEDLRQQLAENPRVWIILLVGSWIASRARLRYGWDYGGIVVPGLLAIAWLTPVQIVGTVLEVLVLTAAMHLLLSFPGFRSINFTGSRPLVLCFILEYLLQIALSHVLPIYLPEVRVSHILGIGYIMSSLLAIRCWRAGDTIRVMIPALWVSFGGAAVATAISISLAVLNPGITPRFSTPLVVTDPLIALANAPMRTDAPLHLDLRSDRHEAAARALLRGEEPSIPADMNLDIVGSESILSESLSWSATGRGALALRPGTPLAVVVPPTSRQPMALLAGLALREKLGASALLIRPDNLLRWPTPALLRAIRAEGVGTISLSLGDSKAALAGGATLADGIQSLSPYLTQEAPGEASLVLSRTEAIALAALVFGKDPRPWPGLLAVVSQDEIRTALPSPADSIQPTLADVALLDPVLGDGSPDAVRMAAGLAERLGLRVYEGKASDGVAFRALGSIPGEGRPAWVAIMREGGTSRVIEVPDACTERDTLAMAWDLWEQSNARALLARCSRPDEVEHTAMAAGAFYNLLFRRVLLSLPAEDTQVLGLRPWHPPSHAEADMVVVSEDAWAAEIGVLPWIQDALRPLLNQGATVTPYTATVRQIGFRDPANVRRRLSTTLIDRRYATVYVAHRVRAWYEPTLSRLLAEQEALNP